MPHFPVKCLFWDIKTPSKHILAQASQEGIWSTPVNQKFNKEPSTTFRIVSQPNSNKSPKIKTFWILTYPPIQSPHPALTTITVKVNFLISHTNSMPYYQTNTFLINCCKLISTTPIKRLIFWIRLLKKTSLINLLSVLIITVVVKT